MPDGSRKIVGATDATRGCKHRCRHCPIVPGLRRPVPRRARSMSSWPTFARRWSRARRTSRSAIPISSTARRTRAGSSRRCTANSPALTYDAIIKVEHLLEASRAAAGAGGNRMPLRHERGRIGRRRRCSRSSRRGTRAPISLRRRRVCRDAGVTLVPTFVAFTPWTTIDGYIDLLNVVDDVGLAANVAPVQWGIRLLVTWAVAAARARRHHSHASVRSTRRR